MNEVIRSKRLAAWLVSLAAAACAIPTITPQPFELSGSWRLSDAISELPVPNRVADASIVAASDVSGRHGGTLDAALEFATEPPRRLTITGTDSAVILSLGNANRLLLYTDGRTSQNSIDSDLGECGCQATWSEGVLLVEHLLPGDTHVLETYERSSDGNRLLVTVTLEDERLPRPLVSRRVYRQS